MRAIQQYSEKSLEPVRSPVGLSRHPGSRKGESMTEAEELIQRREEHRVLKERIAQRAALEELVEQVIVGLHAYVAKDSQKSSLLSFL
jgi:hypothetical protein